MAEEINGSLNVYFENDKFLLEQLKLRFEFYDLRMETSVVLDHITNQYFELGKDLAPIIREELCNLFTVQCSMIWLLYKGNIFTQDFARMLLRSDILQPPKSVDQIYTDLRKIKELANLINSLREI